MSLVTINVTQTHIDLYGDNVSLPNDCPIYHATRDAGLDVSFVLFDAIGIEGSYDTIGLPVEAQNFQYHIGDNGIRWSNRREDLHPITFQVEVPD